MNAETYYAEARARMVKEQILARGIDDAELLAAMAQVPRHSFVPAPLRSKSYDDGPLSIGAGQTISQPFMVAAMTQTVMPVRGLRVLEIGTGCGYQTAILAALGAEVYSIELLPKLAAAADLRLQSMGLNLPIRIGDGHLGWPELAPFDRILVACCASSWPERLTKQLAPGGIMIFPLERPDGRQELIRVTCGADGRLEALPVMAVRFVPFVVPSPETR